MQPSARNSSASYALDPLRVEFSVPETLLSQLKPGQKIDVSVGAYPGETYDGLITAIAPQIDVTGHSVAIRARLPNPDTEAPARTLSRRSA